MASTDDLSRLTINTIDRMTAGPLLRLLLALRGQELPWLHPQVSWDVFKRFARFPTESGHELISFQAAWSWTAEDTTDDPDPPLFYVTWSREIHDRDEVRAVQIQWAFNAPGTVLEDAEVWSDEHDTIDEFFDHVEALPQFRALLANGVPELRYELLCDLFTVEWGDGPPPTL